MKIILLFLLKTIAIVVNILNMVYRENTGYDINQRYYFRISNKCKEEKTNFKTG